MNSQMRNDFQNSGAGSVHRPPIDWDDPSNAEERQIWQAATLFERERCALVCEKLTGRRRVVQGAINGTKFAECEIAAAIRKGGAS